VSRALPCRVVGLLLVGLVLMGIGPRDQPPKNRPSDIVTGYRKEMLGYFRPYFLLPITVPAGQTVGDVYSSDFWSLEERAKSCFPTLPAGAPEATTLPTLRPIAASTAGLALGLPDVASFGFAGRTAVQLANATVITTSKGDLRRSLSKDCDYLGPILEERTVSRGTPIKIILGRVVYAKKAGFFGIDASANPAGDAAALAQRLTSIGAASIASVRVLDAQASARFDPNARAGVYVETKAPEPVAFAPAFLPKLVMDGFSWQEPNETAPDKFTWQSFDPAAKADDKQLFEALVDALSK
jgi:hypothetical protein